MPTTVTQTLNFRRVRRDAGVEERAIQIDIPLPLVAFGKAAISSACTQYFLPRPTTTQTVVLSTTSVAPSTTVTVTQTADPVTQYVQSTLISLEQCVQ